MSDQDDLGPDVSSMLKKHLADVEVPADVRARLASSFGIAGGMSGSGGSDPGAGDSGPKPDSPSGPMPHAGDVSSTMAALAPSVAGSAVRTGLLIAFGAVVGFGASELRHSASPPKERIVERTVIVERAAAPAASEEREASPSVPEPAPRELPLKAVPPRTAQSQETGRDTDTSLRSERVLIEAARSALARGDANAALARLDEHERHFRSGQLAESREALRVQALALTGNSSEAERRAAAFKRAYPGSLFGPVVDGALPKVDAGR